MSNVNFGYGRSWFFNKGTKEIKFLGTQADLHGRYSAEIRDLVKGTVSLRMVSIVKLHGNPANPVSFRIHRPSNVHA